MKRLLVLASLLLVPAFAAAAGHARYRIDLRSGKQFLSRDLPVQRGSVVTFHREDDGKLTGVPAEDVVAIQSGTVVSARSAANVVARDHVSAIQTLAHPLQPGDIVVLGPTGSGSAQSQPGNGSAGAAGMSSGAAPNTPPANNAYGGGYPFVPTGMTPNGQATFAPQPGNTLSAQSGTPPTVGPDGFPVTSGAPPVIGANGTPTTGAPAPVIGSNGTPVSPGTAGAAQPVIGPNGTPVLAPAGAPGAAPPAIGPNGTPVLAPAGAPGSAPPAIGPNGTPATAAPGANPGSHQ